MKISTKGQITIPVAIRVKLGLLPDTEVSFSIKDQAVLIKKQENSKARGGKLISQLAGKSTVQMSTDAIMKLTRS